MNTIRHIRKNVLQTSQSGFAVLANTTQATVCRWEREELFPNLDQMRAIRAAVLSEGKDWDDAWFFDAPKTAHA